MKFSLTIILGHCVPLMWAMIIPGLGYICAKCVKRPLLLVTGHWKCMASLHLPIPCGTIKGEAAREESTSELILWKWDTLLISSCCNTREPGLARKLSNHEHCLTIQNYPQFDWYARETSASLFLAIFFTLHLSLVTMRTQKFNLIL